MLASTTPLECIQERTTSGSSFRPAVAPRGRLLSWRLNISGPKGVKEEGGEGIEGGGEERGGGEKDER